MVEFRAVNLAMRSTQTILVVDDHPPALTQHVGCFSVPDSRLSADLQPGLDKRDLSSGCGHLRWDRGPITLPPEKAALSPRPHNRGVSFPRVP
jgi:hypothetical protein